MKLSSSTLFGCCFCCYCHCWLMMLLMVSSVVHVSPEISTTFTTTTKKYTKLNNNNNNNNMNNNNYAYQSQMTEFVHLNRIITNRTSRTQATLKSLLTTTPSQLPATITTTPTTDYLVNNYRIFENEHKTITTAIVRKEKQSNATKTNSVAATPPSAIVMTTLLPAPEKIQMMRKRLEQRNLSNTTKKMATIEKFIEIKENNKTKMPEVKEVFYKFDNSIGFVKQEPATSRINATTATTNHVADKSSNAFVPQTATMLRIGAHDKKSSKTKRKNNEKLNNNWDTNNDFSSKTKQQHQHNNKNIRSHKSSSSSNRNSSVENLSINANNDNSNSNNRIILRQETTNTFSLNPNNNNNNNETLIVNNNGNNYKQQKNLLKLTVTENGAATALKLTTLLNKNQKTTATRTTIKSSLLSSSTALAIIDSLLINPHNSQIVVNHKSISHNFKNHNKNSMNTTQVARTATTSISSGTADSYLYPKEIISYSNGTQHQQQLQKPTTALATTTPRARVRALPTYSTLHEHQHLSQMRRPLLLHRHSRQASVDDEQNEKCRMFIEGDAEKNELYSPDYPNDYPKNINCTRVIIAPKGQIIRLDFRNSFHIEEKEECKFDFLEIRDGQYGFSNLIGKYCGTDFPPEITSKERYLWLHFHSDESIEYSGFTAVYEFIDRNRDAPSTDLNCTIEKDGYEGFINATDVPADIKDTVIRNKIPLDCMWRIQVQDKWKIQVKFVDFKLAKPNDCETNFLDIFPEQTVMPLRVKNFCGSAGEGITSESNILHMRFYAEQIAINSTFSILYTAFRDRGSSSCVEGEYDCEDATCISAELQCNGRDNCKFRWDEEGCKPEDEGQSEHMIIIITVFGLILGGMIITFLVNCVRKIMHDQKIIREHIRQSKESKLDEMGRNSKARSRDNLSIVSPRQKHSQTSLQILDDVSSRYYREMELQTKSGFKEKDPSILRHDMIVQTSLCSTDDSSTTITEPQTEQQQQQQHKNQKQPQTSADGISSNACDMGCQTRESLFATASLMRQKSKTPSIVGSQRTIEGVPPPPRFSTFGYDAAQIAPPPPPSTVSTLSRRNMHLPQESLEMEQLPRQTTHAMTMMPTHHQHQQQLQQHSMQHQQPHQHLHHRPSQEICHHHHQHQQHLQQQQQQQKQILPRYHAQQQQQQQAQLQQPHHQQSHYQHHTSTTTIPPNITQLPAQGTTVVTAISTGTSGRHKEQSTNPTGGITGGGKNKQTKVDESKVFIDIRNSAPDVIIMTSH